jgi:hypothetical protein
MSEKLPQNNQNEEVDLGQLFNAIGKLFNRLFEFIGKILKGIFSAIIYLIKPFVVNFKLVLVVVLGAAILGFVYEKLEKPIYTSDMIVKPYFDSKYQLSNNIDYFNELINSERLDVLADIFEIDTVEAKSLKRFDLKQGPESPNKLFQEYDEYIQSVDTSLVDSLTYEQYVENRDLFSGDVYTIIAKSYRKDIFPKLEPGLRKTFINELSEKIKARRDTISDIEIQSLEQQLKRLDTIQKTYLEVLRNESERSKLSIDFGSSLPLQESKTETKEYEVLLKELEIRQALKNLKTTLAEESTYYDVLSNFDGIGSKEVTFKQNFTLLLPVLALVGLFFAFFGIKVFNFIKNYD